MFNFTNQKVDTGNNLMPPGTLAWGVVNVRGLKSSQSTSAEYADIELTILGGPYENRKLFTNVMSPMDERHSEAGRQMGFAAVLHMVESAGLVDLNNADSYAWLNAVTFTDIMAHLDGKAVAFKTRHEKDKSGAYPDRDGVGEWLSPNPVRSGTAFKGYQALAEGKVTMKPSILNAPAQQGPLPFGSKPAHPPVQPNGFVPAGNSPLAPQPGAGAGQGFVPPPAAQVPAPGFVPPAGAPVVPQQAPSVGPGAPGPAWLGGPGQPNGQGGGNPALPPASVAGATQVVNQDPPFPA